MMTQVQAWKLFQDQVTALAQGSKRFKSDVRRTHALLLAHDREFYIGTMEYRYLYELFSMNKDGFLLNLYQTRLSYRQFNSEIE